MSIDSNLITNPGGIFTRLGAVGGILRSARVDATTLDSLMSGLNAQYGVLPNVVKSALNARDGWANAKVLPIAVLQQVARDTLIEMIHGIEPLEAKTLDAALTRLIADMRQNSRALDASTITHSGTATGQEDGTANVGTGECVVSLTDNLNIRLDHIRTDTVTLICTNDSQFLKGPASGAEVFSIKGEFATPDPANQYWKTRGSGINASITAAAADVESTNGIGQNLLRNSSFEEFAAGVPESWAITVGAGGGTVDETATKFRGIKALKITGDGSQLTRLHQLIDDAAGTPSFLKSETKYLLSFQLRHDGVAPAAGVLRVSVRDGSNNLVGTAISVTLSGITNAFDLYSATVHVPRDVPTGCRVVIELTTALTNTRAIFLDELMLMEMRQFGGPSGPYIALLAGATDFIIRDRIALSFENDMEGELIMALDMLLNLYEGSHRIPTVTDGSEYVLDTLLTF